MLGACRAESTHSSASTATPPAASALPPPGAASAAELVALQTITVSRLAESERGGVAVVLLHGYGAAGDDLASLAERLARPGSRFILPAAPLPQGSGRAWWRIEGRRPPHAWDEQLPGGFVPNPQVASARRQVQQLLRDVKARYAPGRLVLAGFSQGAMLSLDVALQAEPSVDRVGVLSGVMLADSLAALKTQRIDKPRFFMSHGRSDTVLPFAAAERAYEMLDARGYSVDFHDFDGGHQIPADVSEALAKFIYDGAPPYGQLEIR
ncbi:MAG TPA: alpha/beta fold hydrolase [Polyangiaceae bacterium]|nr:alpha/beta fold hydrolase [Polyangiaceae bacterium]